MSKTASGASSGAQSSTSTGGRPPGEFDVLFGPGAPLREHPGNKRYREIVNEYVDLYDDTPRNDRSMVADRVTNLVSDGERVRYFIREGRGGPWRLATEQEIRKTVMRSLRELRGVRQKKKGDPKSKQAKKHQQQNQQQLTATAQPSPQTSRPTKMIQPPPSPSPSTASGYSSTSGHSSIVSVSGPSVLGSAQIPTQLFQLNLRQQASPVPSTLDLPNQPPSLATQDNLNFYPALRNQMNASPQIAQNQPTALQNPVFAPTFQPEDRAPDPDVMEFVDDIEPIPLNTLSGYLPDFDRLQLSNLFFNVGESSGASTTKMEGFDVLRSGILELQRTRQWEMPDYGDGSMDTGASQNQSQQPQHNFQPQQNSLFPISEYANEVTPPPELLEPIPIQRPRADVSPPPPPLLGRRPTHDDDPDSDSGDSMGSFDMAGLQDAISGMSDNFEQV